MTPLKTIVWGGLVAIAIGCGTVAAQPADTTQSTMPGYGMTQGQRPGPGYGNGPMMAGPQGWHAQGRGYGYQQQAIPPRHAYGWNGPMRPVNDASGYRGHHGRGGGNCRR